MATVTIMVGPPGCGKSTRAREMVKQKQNTVIVCRDDIRQQLFGTLVGYKPNNKNETLVTAIQLQNMQLAIKAGQNVIVADTNCKQSTIQTIRDAAKAGGATDVHILDLVKEYVGDNVAELQQRGLEGVYQSFRKRCHKWNLLRENSVPPEVVDRMMDNYMAGIAGFKVRQHVMVVGVPTAILVDIDGTVASMGDRSAFDWKRVGEDSPIPEVIRTVDLYRKAGYRIIFMSGRDEVCRPETEEWLQRHNIQYEALFMRKKDDQRMDSIVKEELFFANVQDKYNVEIVLDDRDQVVSKWRAMGLKVYQVAPGSF